MLLLGYQCIFYELYVFRIEYTCKTTSLAPGVHSNSGI